MKTTTICLATGRTCCNARKPFGFSLLSTVRVAVGLLAVLPSSIKAAAAGICLHAYSPEAPLNKIECFEYVKFETMSNGYRFFLSSGSPVVVTNYRFRNVLVYSPELSPENPEFQKILAIYEKTASDVPSTRVFLNAHIQRMRALASAQQQSSQKAAALPKINIDGEEYVSPRFKRCEEGNMILSHKDGTAKIKLAKITDQNLSELQKIDKEASKLKAVSIDGKRIWNPEFAGLTQSSIQIKHENGNLAVPIDTISDADKRLILSWSDGTWKIQKPGLYDPSATGNGYSEIVLENGKFHENVSFLRHDSDLVVLKTSEREITIPISKVANLKGVTKDDESRINLWIEEIIQERIEKTEPKTSPEVLSFEEADELLVTNVRLKILQILDNGLLASGFVGTLHKGTNTVKWTETVTVKHPVTGEDVIRVTNTTTGKEPVEEPVIDDLCFIVGNTADFAENQIVKARSIKLDGTYKYIDVRGAPRTVRRYRVEPD